MTHRIDAVARCTWMRTCLLSTLPLIAVLLLPLVVTCPAAMATTSIASPWQETDDTQKSELGQRQRAVLQRWAQLEGQFMSMAEKLKETQPERADRLIVALNTARQNLIARRMETVAGLLDTGKLAQANQELDDVIKELEALVRLLLNDQSNRMDKQEELEFLEQVKKNIQNLLQDQNQQTRETFKISNREQVDQDLKQAIAQIDNLIQKQQSLQQKIQDTPRNLKAQDRAAEDQFQLRQQTLETARSLEDKFGGKPLSGETQESRPNPSDNRPMDGETSEGPGSEQKPGEQAGESKPGEQAGEQKPGEQAGESKPGESKPGEQKPGEQKPGEQAGESKPGEQKPGEQKPGEQKPGEQGGESQPGENKPGQESSPASGSPSDPKPSDKNQPTDQSNTGQAAQQLKQASEKQQEAERALAEGDNQKASESQEQAIEDLQQAKQKLEQERRRLSQLPEEAAQQQSPEQRRLADRTKELSDKIAQAKLPSKEQPKNADGSPADQAQAGKPKVDQAQSEMQQAADGLDENSPESANENQKKAEEQLQEALAEIEERLNQLREETREERLARLEARFMELLLRQQDLRGRTEVLDDKLVSLQQQNVRDRLILAELSTQQAELAELCQLAYDLLLEDGTSVVFPEIVAEVQTDMLQAAGLLKERQTGGLVQLLHREIESTLEELLAALKQSKNKGDGGGGGGGEGGGGEQPLVKRSAELKMLRAAQLRVNRKTRQLNEINQQNLLPAGQINEELQRLAGRQTDIIELTQRLIESIQAEGQPGPPPGGQAPPEDE